MRRVPAHIEPYKTSVESAGDNGFLLRFETPDGTVTATLPGTTLQLLQEQIGQVLEPRKITRGWGGHLNPNLAAAEPQGDAVVEGDFAPGLGRALR